MIFLRAVVVVIVW